MGVFAALLCQQEYLSTTNTVIGFQQNVATQGQSYLVQIIRGRKSGFKLSVNLVTWFAIVSAVVWNAKLYWFFQKEVWQEYENGQQQQWSTYNDVTSAENWPETEVPHYIWSLGKKEQTHWWFTRPGGVRHAAKLVVALQPDSKISPWTRANTIWKSQEHHVNGQHTF